MTTSTDARTESTTLQRPTHNGGRSAKFAAVASALAVASSLPSVGSGSLTDLLWVTVLSMGCMRLLRSRGGALPVAAVLFLLAGFTSLLCVSAVWSVASPLPLPMEQWSLRLGLTACALMMAAALRPLVPPKGEGPGTAVVLGAAAPVLAVPFTLASPLLRSGRMTGGLMLTALQHEDGAAWVSQALATFRYGHLPNTATQSEFAFYPLTSASVGSVFQTLVHGRPTDDQAVIAAVDSVVASWALCGLTLGVASFVMMLQLMPGRARSSGFPVVAAAALASAITQVAVWTLVVPLTDRQQLSLAWAGAALAALVVMITAAGQLTSLSVPMCIAVLLLSTAAAGSWPFGLPGIGMAVVGFSVLLWGRQGRRSIPLIVCLLAGQALGVIEVIQHMTGFGFTPTTLLDGRGGYIEIQAATLAVLTIALVAAAYSPIRKWPFRIVVLTTSSLALGALATWLVATSNYGPAKATYLALLTLPLGLALGLGWIACQPNAALRWSVLAATAVVMVSSPVTGRVAHRAEQILAEPTPGIGERLIQVAEASAHHEKAVCLPSADLADYKNYLCQRWVDAFSRSQSDVRIRWLWLASQGDVKAALRRAEAEGMIDGDVVFVNARWVISGTGEPGIGLHQPNTTKQ